MNKRIIRTKPPRTPKRRKRVAKPAPEAVFRKGASHPASKLSDSERRQIIKLYGGGATQTKLGKKYGISQSAVSHIVRVQSQWLDR